MTPKPDKPTNFFTQHRASAQQAAQYHRQHWQRLSLARLVAFALTVVLIFYFVNERNVMAALVSLVLGVGIFAALLVAFQRQYAAFRRAEKLTHLHDEELDRLAHRFEHLPDGARFASVEHPYAADLDLFGRHSLYQYLRRTATPEGDDVLAEWLLYPALADVATRQATVRTLAADPAWGQGWVVQARLAVATALPTAWPAVPRHTSERGGWVWLTRMSPVLALAALGWWLVGGPIYPLLVLVLVHGTLLSRLVPVMGQVGQSGGLRAQSLGVYADLLGRIERTNFPDMQWGQWQQTLRTPQPASAAIDQLRRIVRFFDARANLFYGLANVLLLLDFRTLARYRTWEDRYAGLVPQWRRVLGEVDATLSLAATAFAHPDWVYPTLTDDGAWRMAGQGLAHPLLPKTERVANDWHLAGRGRAVVITGANMSGKSTFLRTLGINVVLAQMGAPVCAEALVLAPVRLFTSMRSQDSLQAHISSFYAELRRIRQLLDLLVQPGPPVFYVLDELLKGTNSADRYRGAVALVRQLQALGTTGIVSTHDLELGQLADADPEGIVNYSFNSTVVGSEIRFDYRLTPGVCRSFNAVPLMRQMGIAIPEGIETPLPPRA